MIKWRILLSLIVLFQCSKGFGQHEFRAVDWHFIESSIDKKSNLSDALSLVKEMGQKAMTGKKYFYAARCYYYQVQIADLRTEDSLYFKNSAFIDTLLAEPDLPTPLQFCFRMIMAKRLENFTQRYNRFQRMTYERKDIPVNYAAWTNDGIDSVAMIYFNMAKGLPGNIAIADIDEALWLSSDPLQFLYKPGLFDLVIAEQISVGRSFYQVQDGLPFLTHWFDLSPGDFVTKLDSLTDTRNSFLLKLELYREWLHYHNANREAWSFIESMARKFVYNGIKTRDDDDAGKAYERYLLQLTHSPYTAAKAHGVYQLCLLWNSQASLYFPKTMAEYNDYWATNKRNISGYDTTYRYHAVKAVRLFEANRSLMDSFYYLSDILQRMEVQTRSTGLVIRLEENNLPNETFISEVKFKNADSLHYRIIKLKTGYSFTETDQIKELNYLLGLPVYNDKIIRLPATDDYNYHNVYLKMEALPAGRYALLFSNHAVIDTSYQTRPVFFNVTNIAVVNNDQRVYVLNRKTGFPLAGAVVKASYSSKNSVTGVFEYHSKNYTVNKQGYITVGDDRYKNLEVRNGVDTVTESASYYEYETPDDVYDKEEYDDLAEFYDDNATAYVFTDRAIYRPGQTVFYKTIFMTKNPKTGEPMIMNRKNLKGKLFGSVYKKWLKDNEPLLEIEDPFGKKMDSLKIAPNEYGSVSGSFKIPKTAATGDWSIEPDYIDKEGEGGTFRVEEYKRPTYEITIDKPKEELLPGDEFVFKVRVRSFAGAALNNVKVEYSVERNGALPQTGNEEAGGENVELLDTTGYTDAQGQLEIRVKDAQLKTYDFDKGKEWNFSYNLDVSAIDATGESYSADVTVNVSTRPLLIRIPVMKAYERSHFTPATVTVNDINAGTVSKDVIVDLYRVEKKKKLYNDHNLTSADLWLYDKNELRQQFPYLDMLATEEEKETRKLVYSDTINSGKEGKLLFKPEWLPAGNYELIARSMDKGIIRGEKKASFTVFDLPGNQLPEPTWEFNHMAYNAAAPGETLTYYYGNTEAPVYSVFHAAYFTANGKTPIRYDYKEQQDAKGVHQYQLKIPAAAIDRLELTHVYIIGNQLFTHTEDIYVNNKQVEEPVIVIEKYRKKLAPGSKETFSISVQTKNENTAAELMTTMYDASLDKLEQHVWEKPSGNSYRNIGTDWAQNINRIVGDASGRGEMFILQGWEKADTTKTLWWLNPSGFAYDSVWGDWKTNGMPGAGYMLNDGYLSSQLSGRVAGLTVINADGLNDVVVVGYGSVKRSEVTASVVNIRGANTLSFYNQPLIILDGVPYTGDLSKIDGTTIVEGMVLKGADASAIYGARAAQGVLVLSTKGKIVFPQEPEPEIVTRKNFSESAFFFPALHADRKGMYSFTFTMPESVTEWNWKMMAHTKSALFAYAERKLNSQLPLMVQPNMPRLLYQGDRMVLQSRISNLDTSDASGKIVCTIEDEVTGEDITSKVLSVAQHDFSVNKKANIASSFELKVPADQLNPLKVIITVRTKNFTDGEEHIIPVLSPKIFVRDNQSFVFTHADTVLQLPSVAAEDLYGVGLSIAAKPQTALINSLPYLANYPFGCAEQTFNKLLANITALQLMRIDTLAQHSFNSIKEKADKEDPADEKLPAELAEETMPWLNLSNRTALQQKQLLALLDTTRALPAINELLHKLYALQRPDGGLSWFDGGESDFYISCYVLRGFGKLRKNKQLIPSNTFDNQFNIFIHSLVKYCDNHFSDKLEDSTYYLNLYYCYVRSHWTAAYLLDDSLNKTARKMLLQRWKNVSQLSLYNQAVLILSSLYFSTTNDELYNKAISQLQSLRQSAITDEIYGMRWKELSDDEDLTNSAEETIVLLAEAFETAGMKDDREIAKWLLSARSEHRWSNTKATAAAIDLLGRQDNQVTGIPQTITTGTGNETLTVTDNLFSGSVFRHTKSVSLPAEIRLHKESATPAKGTIALYYFSASGQLSNLNKNVQLIKQFYKWNNSSGTWEPFTGDAILKIADRVRVVITIESARPLSYVYIDDKRSAAFEPGDINSGYQYGEGYHYYQSIRDAGYQFFADFIPSGRHQIIYELKVAQEGSFLSGPASLQCMYKPEVTAYSNSLKVTSTK